jgi:hypothetical protein
MKRAYQAPAHLIELYKKSITINDYKTLGIFLEAPKILP